MANLQLFFLFLAILLSALIAGLLYGYSCSVNPGLGALSDTAYLKAMQSINKAILNPVFFFSFMGTLIVLPVAAGMFYSKTPTASFYCLLIAAMTYAGGVFAVTLLFNVPLNNALEAFVIDKAGLPEISAQRLRFEMPWNRFHLIRTLAAVASLCFSILAALLR